MQLTPGWGPEPDQKQAHTPPPPVPEVQLREGWGGPRATPGLPLAEVQRILCRLSGSVHSTAHQLIPTGVPLDPGRWYRRRAPAVASACSQAPLPPHSFGRWRFGAVGSEALLQRCSWESVGFGPEPWVPPPYPGPYFLPGSSSLYGQTPRWPT